MIHFCNTFTAFTFFIPASPSGKTVKRKIGQGSAADLRFFFFFVFFSEGKRVMRTENSELFSDTLNQITQDGIF